MSVRQLINRYMGSAVSTAPFDPVGQQAGSNAVIGGGVVTPPVVINAQKVIWDTDLDTDCDDISATALLMRFIQTGEAQLLATTVASNNGYSVAAMRVLLNRNGLQAVPLGAYMGSTINDGGNGTASTWPKAIVDNFGTVANDNRANYPTAVTVLRTALAAAPNASVKIMCGGSLTNLRALLESPADGISALTGVQLVAAKCISWHQMGGCGNSTTTPENGNVGTDLNAANYVAQNVPVPMYWAGLEIGNVIKTRIPYYVSPATDVYQSSWGYTTSLQDTNGERESWDLAPVIHAIRGLGTLFGYVGQNGTVSFDSSFNTTFTPNTGGKHSFLSLAALPATARNLFNSLIYDFVSSFLPNLIQAPRFIQPDGAPIAPWNTSLSVGTFTINVANEVCNTTSSGSANRARIYQDLGTLPAGNYAIASDAAGGGRNVAVEDTLSTGNILALNAVTGRQTGTFTLAAPTRVYYREERTNGTSGTTFNLDNAALARVS